MTARSPQARQRFRRRVLAPLAGLGALAMISGVAVSLAASDDGQSGATAGVESTIGLPVDRVRLIGADGDDVWGYGFLRSVPADANGDRVPATTPYDAHVVMVHNRPGGGWTVAGQPVDPAGQPVDNFTPIGEDGAEGRPAGGAPGDASMDASGAGAMLGKLRTGETSTPALAVRDPGGRFTVATPPEPAPAPADPGTPGPTTPVENALSETEAPSTQRNASGGSTAAATKTSATPTATNPGPTSPDPTTPDPEPTTPDPTTPDPTTPDPATPDPATPDPATPAGAPPAGTSPAAAVSTPTTPAGTRGRAAADGAIIQSDERLFVASRRSVLAVREPSGRAGALIGLLRETVTPEDAVLHYDGSAWTREPISVPDELQEQGFRIVAIAGTGLNDAWLLGRSAAAGLALFHREANGTWQPRTLGDSPFAAPTAAGGVTSIGPLPQPAQALTVSESGVWMDGSLVSGGIKTPFTVYYDKQSKAITGSWCDPDLCANHPGPRFDDASGYRSFAWSGSGRYGQRVITNSGRGTRLVLAGTSFRRVTGLGAGGANSVFTDPQEGWMVTGADASDALVHVTAAPKRPNLQSWPLPFRRPLLAIATEPGRTPGAENAGALAVGSQGTVGRYTPGQGWDPEYLQDGSGARQVPELRGVAWPEQGRAHAVGAGGAMWLWRGETGLWEPDPAKPLDFYANLLAVSFQPATPDRGYAVGRSGVLLSYGKTWTQESVPADRASMDFTSVAFAGTQALVSWRSPDGVQSGVLVSDNGGPWHDDASAAALLAQSENATLLTVAGLPDGGAVAGGNGIVIKRESAGSAWRRTATPPTGLAVIAAAAVREAGALNAVIAVYATSQYPLVEEPVLTGVGESPQLLNPVPLPLGGSLLREDGSGGWRDESRLEQPRAGVVVDEPVQQDKVYALALDPTGGQGWAVGGQVISTGDDAESLAAQRDRQTAAAFRYPGDPSAAPSLTGASPVPLDTPRARFAVGGQAACRAACADGAKLGLAADVGLRSALTAAGGLAASPSGPRAFLYTGPRLQSGKLDGPEAAQFASSAASPGNLPFYPTAGADAAGLGSAPFSGAFAGFPAPFGQGAQPSNVDTPGSLPGASARDGEARNHYAFDSLGPEGAVRVIVINNGPGSLAAADPDNLPRDPSQERWLIATLADAKDSGVPAIVMGNRDLDTRAGAGSGVADDAARVSALLVEGGASAYFFAAPGANRRSAIPAGASRTIPEFGTGTLGYSSTMANDVSPFYGEAGYLLAEIDAKKVDPVTNVAPVSVRMIPVLQDLAIEATDGLLVRRSRATLFRALGRRPRMGGAAPYVVMPPTACKVISCPGRIEPEYSFTSSRPDIADFVKRDTRTTDPRAVLLDSSAKPVADAGSALLCAYNSGTTTVTVRSGGLAYSQKVTVQAGSPARPCGTRPKLPDTARAAPVPVAPLAPVTPANPAPAASPAAAPPVVPPPPPPPPAPNPPVVPPPVDPFVPVPPPVTPAAITLLPPPPAVAQPLPPPGASPIGVSQPVSQVEEKREEEVATEQSSAYAIAEPTGSGRIIGGGALMMLILLAGGAGAAGVTSGRQRSRTQLAPVTGSPLPLQRKSASRSPRPRSQRTGRR